MSAADDDWLAAQLRETERGEAAGHLAHRLPPWYPWTFGVWVFSLSGGQYALASSLTLAMLWTLAHFVLLYGYQWCWADRRRGVRARGRAPAEFRVFWVVVALLIVAFFFVHMTVLIDVATGWWGAAVLGVTMAAFAWLVDRVHARITRTVEERLA